MFPTYPMISSRAKRIRSFAEEAINLAKENTNDMTYLIRQGQEVVIEDNGGSGRLIILVVISLGVTKMTEIGAHFHSSPGDLDGERLGEATHEPDKRETHRSLPMSITSFNVGEDMGGEKTCSRNGTRQLL